MRPLIVGNWKMNGLQTDAEAIAGALRQPPPGCDLLICPPATMLMATARVLAGSSVMVGGQDCHTAEKGAHTGDISAAMLRDAGATWVILGHSERRADHGESNEVVQAKVRAAIAAGLTPIICVGETESDRLALRQTEIVGAQLKGCVPQDFHGAVAYEPVWAIGTGRTPTEADVAAMHRFIRATLVGHLGQAGLQPRILYGGSVKPSNAAALLGLPEIGGALVGGASLVAADFLAIAQAAASHAFAAGVVAESALPR